MTQTTPRTSISSLVASLKGAAIALGLSALVAPAALADEKAETFIITNGAVVLEVLNDDTLSHAEREVKFYEFMNTFADYKSIARRVLGPTTRTMSEDQLTAYYAAFEGYAIAVYHDQLEQFRGEKIIVTGSKDLSARNSHVSSKIHSSDTGKNVEVIWDVLTSRDGKRHLVRDVALNINGNNQFWLAVDQHEDFKAFLRANNNDVDKLIANIETMTKDMKARR